MEDRARTPKEVRRLCRANAYGKPTCSLCSGHVQANLVILPRSYGPDFEQFCHANPKACPLLEVLDEGPISTRVAPGADVRTDLPGYIVYSGGKGGEEVADVVEYWPDERTDSLVGFLLGCSFGFEAALDHEGLTPRHNQLGSNVPMFVSRLESNRVGTFHGNLVVSMRSYPESDVEKVRNITRKYPESHGSPLHCGSPDQIGISALDQPDFGDPVPVLEGETPMFWGCGVTPARVCTQSGINFFITHAPGKMLVCDMLAGEQERPG